MSWLVQFLQHCTSDFTGLCLCQETNYPGRVLDKVFHLWNTKWPFSWITELLTIGLKSCFLQSLPSMSIPCNPHHMTKAVLNMLFTTQRAFSLEERDEKRIWYAHQLFCLLGASVETTGSGKVVLLLQVNPRFSFLDTTYIQSPKGRSPANSLFWSRNTCHKIRKRNRLIVYPLLFLSSSSDSCLSLGSTPVGKNSC